jgi:hypothetical protein
MGADIVVTAPEGLVCPPIRGRRVVGRRRAGGGARGDHPTRPTGPSKPLRARQAARQRPRQEATGCQRGLWLFARLVCSGLEVQRRSGGRRRPSLRAEPSSRRSHGGGKGGTGLISAWYLGPTGGALYKYTAIGQHYQLGEPLAPQIPASGISDCVIKASYQRYQGGHYLGRPPGLYSPASGHEASSRRPGLAHVLRRH